MFRHRKITRLEQLSPELPNIYLNRNIKLVLELYGQRLCIGLWRHGSTGLFLLTMSGDTVEKVNSGPIFSIGPIVAFPLGYETRKSCIYENINLFLVMCKIKPVCSLVPKEIHEVLQLITPWL
jgi:hypothetical protein